LTKNVHELLARQSSVVAVGGHDGLSGRLGQNAGFDAIWGSGFEIAASFGVPDANILTMTDQLRACQAIAEAVDIPVVADCDNGFGNAINAAAAVRKFEAAGISGICIEDNVFPKRCSFYEDTTRELTPAREHALKVRACKDAQRSDEFFVIARTEAFIAGAGLQEALDRAHSYAEAGADAVLVHSKKPTSDELLEFSAQWTSDVPLVAVPTTYDTTSVDQLAELGYRMVIFANQGIRSAIRAVERNLALLRSAGHASVLNDEMVPLSRVFELVGLDQLQADEAKYMSAEAVLATSGAGR
jgi:phosphoenolpyruvate phosphomutase